MKPMKKRMATVPQSPSNLVYKAILRLDSLYNLCNLSRYDIQDLASYIKARRG
jgi:hypothetical protein